jgi:hypothetical protein
VSLQFRCFYRGFIAAASRFLSLFQFEALWKTSAGQAQLGVPDTSATLIGHNYGLVGQNRQPFKTSTTVLLRPPKGSEKVLKNLSGKADIARLAFNCFRLPHLTRYDGLP